MCTAHHTTGCDRIEGDRIYDGGNVFGQVSSAINSNTIVVTITKTSVPHTIALGQARIGHDLGHHAIAIIGTGFDGIPFCSAQSPSDYCGA